MRTKKITTIVALLLTCLSFSQNSFTAKDMADFQDKIMIDELSLSEEQTKKVSEVNIKYATKLKVLIDREGSMSGKRDDMKKIGTAKKDELSKILTEIQFKKYENDLVPKIRKHMRKNMKL